MKLFYDNLYPFMPNSKIIDDTPVIDPKLDALRRAMVMLAEFQNTHNLVALYESVHQISIFADIDITKLILSLETVKEIEGKAGELLDVAAKQLFLTSAPNYDYTTFDYKKYAVILLSVAHSLLEAQRQLDMDITPEQNSEESVVKEVIQ